MAKLIIFENIDDDRFFRLLHDEYREEVERLKTEAIAKAKADIAAGSMDETAADAAEIIEDAIEETTRVIFAEQLIDLVWGTSPDADWPWDEIIEEMRERINYEAIGDAVLEGVETSDCISSAAILEVSSDVSSVALIPG